jgi:hypothetical protein
MLYFIHTSLPSSFSVYWRLFSFCKILIYTALRSSYMTVQPGISPSYGRRPGVGIPRRTAVWSRATYQRSPGAALTFLARIRKLYPHQPILMFIPVRFFLFHLGY